MGGIIGRIHEPEYRDLHSFILFSERVWPYLFLPQEQALLESLGPKALGKNYPSLLDLCPADFYPG